MDEDRVPLTIDVKTTGDSTAVNQSAQSLDQLGAKGKQAAAGTMDASKGLGLLGQAAGAASGNLSSVAGLLNGLAQKVPALAGPVAIAAGAFASWTTAIQAVNKVLAENAEEVRKGTEAETVAQIEKVNKAYENMAKALEKVNTALTSVRDVEAERRQANRADEDAALELEKQKAMAGVAPGDEIGRRRVEADFAARSAALGAARGGEDSAVKAQTLRDQADAERRAAALSEEHATALIPLRGKVLGQASDLSAQQQQYSGKWYKSQKAEDDLLKSMQPGIDKLLERMASIDAQRQAAIDRAAESRAKAATLDERAAIADRGVGTAAVRAQVASVGASNTVASINYDAEQAATKRKADENRVAQIEREQAEARERLSAGEDAVNRARYAEGKERLDVKDANAALANFDKSKFKGGPVARASARAALEATAKSELDQASAAASNAADETKRTAESAKELTAQIARLAAEMKTLKGRLSSGSADSGQGD